ncbi:bifunctional hydroxymethylpyrimidine kinase/phosphomethylpyrimidine kinase [Brevibacillus laterosporus]|uniref:bifunctional hydroxymethylpyrimidine kinase/phosphomethylpyrimidine kinase n=1 Tax=Brevibacillus laterosporus TaxID=1465 RepID=UPI00215B81B5|nr:bifunctional hydroxymethylpyrimidine kinase/phosphomethylpyrimidine kinase [Brevibacillus laterosporus]MCR8940186.1 bifunctional hydroxymethylpyrimidine kinase/phosphomethylpyrimidine kinase [Brevibacillus laterosporus]MCZ0842825.1 bifunctional hydroxymethylpyrimidine kinase/phosphomethylpyrimidine kinase [Brevibacillus laterosporus]MCZ0846743.1 bifunctional hydroxymethylpyrimidine kinase/phosphomethylpyrimidine kinase [Brevibacillus laterosporus]
MKKPYIAMTIAGSDSGGGAGIQADLKTFHQRGVYGTSALTAITAQNTQGVHGVHVMTPEFVADQIRVVLDDLPAEAIKTGMLANAPIIEAVAEQLRKHHETKLVIDPVMIAKGGAKLLQDEAVQALLTHLLPQAYVITPNLPEAEVLVERTIETLFDMKEAAKHLHDYGVAHVIMKGGHMLDHRLTDILFDGQHFHEIEHERIPTRHTHGTGCTFSACLTAELAKGADAVTAFHTAQQFIVTAIQTAPNLGSGHGPTNHWVQLPL